MRFDPNRIFYEMLASFQQALEDEIRLTICNEGGTRSGKTYDAYDLLTYICDHNRNACLDIYILRDTLVNNRDFTLKDWKKLQKINKIPLTGKDTPKPEYNLFGNNVYFRGLDDEENTEAYPSDILFFNEVLETEKTKVEGLIMRCRKLVIMDWNPKLTKHWVFNYEGKPNVLFTHSTYKDNKHLEKTVVDGIESYNPEIKENVKNGTANLFRWKVYGLGLRADREGNVFNDNELNKFDLEDIQEYLENATILAWGDVADQGIDYFCFPVGLLIGKKTYVIDVIFTPKGSAYTIPLVIQMLIKYDITKAILESNNFGLAYLNHLLERLIVMDLEDGTKLHDKWNSRRTGAIPSKGDKHSRIVVQADINIIENFYFLRHQTGMYADYYDYLTMYKHDKSVKEDDAPDGTAGLSILSQKYN